MPCDIASWPPLERSNSPASGRFGASARIRVPNTHASEAALVVCSATSIDKAFSPRVLRFKTRHCKAVNCDGGDLSPRVGILRSYEEGWAVMARRLQTVLSGRCARMGEVAR